MSVSTILNSLAGAVFWHEKLKPQMIVGTLIILFGVAWVSIVRGTPKATVYDSAEDEADQNYYKLMSIFLALFCGFLSALRI